MVKLLRLLRNRIFEGGSHLCGAVGEWLPYIYFIRFSLLLWLTMPLLVLLDVFNVTTTATRGILTLQDWQQAFWDGFFVVLGGWIALLSARIVTAYGEARFAAPPPERMKVKQDMSWGVFGGAQIPGAILLAYVAHCTACDGHQSLLLTVLSLFAGGVVALAVWYLLAAYYYWTYEPRLDLMREGRLARNPALLANLPVAGLEAKAFLAPVGKCPWFARLQTYPAPAIAGAFNFAYAILVRLFGPGFAKDPNDPRSPINAGHALGFVLLTFMAVLYFVFFHYTAPVWIDHAHAIIAWVVSLALALWFSLAALYWRHRLLARETRGIDAPLTLLDVLKSVLRAGVILVPFWVVVLLAWSGKRNESFPVLASVYILLILACWGLTGLAFILDRFRVPVSIGAVAGLALIHAVAAISNPRSPFAEAQHIVQSNNREIPIAPAAPGAILERFHKTHPPNTPIIVITATGGGIHAASWTAQLLADLETLFAQQNIKFHESILLMSTVSGGSVGAAEWLQAYPHYKSDGKTLTPDGFEQYRATAKDKAGKDPETTAQRLTECSSLEAIAWGLIYPDILHVFVPFRFSAGVEALDRSWALQTAIERNEFSNCGNAPEDRVSNTTFRPTLGNYARLLSGPILQTSGGESTWVPAFSLNATVAETGDRFLFADYKVPHPGIPNSELLPSSSFLDVYQKSACQPPLLPVPDLSLTAAARLSASFPYVSSMARVPICVQEKAYHFGDGGYFDNDGTGTVIEFLHAAYLTGQPSPAAQPQDNILLIEIRDSDDPHSDDVPDGAGNETAKAKLWGPASQIGGPVGTFYHAGHESVTRRNRRELCVLESALMRDPAKARIEHFVLAYHQDRIDFTQPLNWHLTMEDKSEIQRNLNGTVLYTDYEGTRHPAKTPTPTLEARIAQKYRLLQENPTAPKAKGSPGDGCTIEDNQ